MSSISRPPLVVAVDLDEVLGLFVETLARFYNEVYGGTLTAGKHPDDRGLRKV